MKIVVALDAFKGSMTAQRACAATAAVLCRERPAWSVVSCPMADGGEGTAAAMAAAAGGELVPTSEVCGPLPEMRVDAVYAWLPAQRLAVVEMAQASGLPLLPVEKRNPLRTTTLGTGQLLRSALARNPARLLLGLGGSATVDGGMGAARAFGWRFLDSSGADLPLGGGALERLARILPPESPESLPRVEALCDVQNPLCGPNGAVAVFAPQKGATPEMLVRLEAGLQRLAEVVRRDLGLEVATMPGAGAAGGFGAGAVAFFRARLVSGVRTVATACGLHRLLRGADWVITGEGCFDEQSLHGKVVSGVRDAAVAAGVKVAVLAGRVRLPEDSRLAAGFDAAVALAPAAVSEETAAAEAGRRLDLAVCRLIEQTLDPAIRH
ncbi:MAG: glycerate kinase [Kiritimatiellaeota bacterium]|nr:glycerate kinase [Kiritimatiellota bacterium]